jgi:hypothetical protein
MLDELKQQVCAANLKLVAEALIVQTLRINLMTQRCSLFYFLHKHGPGEYYG